MGGCSAGLCPWKPQCWWSSRRQVCLLTLPGRPMTTPGGSAPLPSSAPDPGHPPFLSSPKPSLQQILWLLPSKDIQLLTLSSFHCGQSWSPLTWVTAVLSSVVSLLLPFSLNLSYSSFTQNYLMSWDSLSIKVMFHVKPYIFL